LKYFILPFGCQMNRSDAERVRTVLSSMGYGEAADEDDPEIGVMGIIACSVRQKAIDRVYGRVRNWNRLKSRRPLITFVSGCVLDEDRHKFLKLFDLVFPIDRLPQLPEMIRQYGVPTIPPLADGGVGAPRVGQPGRDEARDRIESFWHVAPAYASAVEAFVPIQNGCDKFCTYCAVPYTRGREVSRPSRDVLEEVESLVRSGRRSITLLGQNVNSYGLDRRGEEMGFAELMDEIAAFGRRSDRRFWTYFTSPHPRDITTDLLDVMAASPVLADWVHLPLQAGDDEVLRRMNRSYDMERYRSVVADIRRILPNAALFTDIIVGFSGESREQFDATAAAMREFRYDMAYIAQYSPRPGARSADWPDDVPRTEKSRRYHVLSRVLQDLALEANRRRVGRVVPVLLTAEDRKPGCLSGYTEGRIPVRVAADSRRIGEIVDVEVVDARPLSLEGRVA